MLNQRKSWTFQVNVNQFQEDQLLIKLYEENKQRIQTQTLHWNFIALKLNQQQISTKRSGKQCRERWFNQLDPDIIKNHLWTQQDKKKLLQLHNVYGNRWALIAKHFPGRTDNCIKNYMNSALRKSLRLLNLFVSKNRKYKQFKFRNLKEYKVEVVNKILYFSGTKNPVSELQRDFCLSTHSSSNKQQVLAEVYRLAADIKTRLMWIQTQIQGDQEDLGSRITYKPILYFQQLIEKIHELNGICKKRKQKKSQSQSFRWKKTKVKQSQTELPNLDFHGCSFIHPLDLIPELSKLKVIQQFDPSDISSENIKYLNNQLKIQKYHSQFERQPQIPSFGTEQTQFKFKIQQSQNNGNGNKVKISCKVEQTNSVILKCCQQRDFSKKVQIKPNQCEQSHPKQTSIERTEQISSSSQSGQKNQLIKGKDIKTRPSISFQGQKSNDQSPGNILNLQYESEMELQDQYGYLGFSDSKEDEYYMPLYPWYGNSTEQRWIKNGQVADCIYMNDGSGSEEQVI